MTSAPQLAARRFFLVPRPGHGLPVDLGVSPWAGIASNGPTLDPGTYHIAVAGEQGLDKWGELLIWGPDRWLCYAIDGSMLVVPQGMQWSDLC